jgi:hypothetical protein
MVYTTLMAKGTDIALIHVEQVLECRNDIVEVMDDAGIEL